MLRVARYTLVAASITLTLVGCQDATAPDNAPRGLSARPMMSAAAAALVPRIIEPRVTDPEITYVPVTNPQLNHHYVWLDPAARENHKLLVLPPGGGRGSSRTARQSGRRSQSPANRREGPRRRSSDASDLWIAS